MIEMETKHTRGPWVKRPIDLYEGGNGFEVVAEDGEVICDNQTYYPHAVTESNGTLIAAAPDLLEVCQRLLEAVPYVSEYDVPIGLWDDLRGAVAKATRAGVGL